MNENKVNVAIVILYCICAVVWDINLIVDFVYGNTKSFLLVLHIICAAAWSLCAVAGVIRYIRLKRNK